MFVSPGNCQHIGARSTQQDAFGFSDIDDKVFVAHGGVLAVVLLIIVVLVLLFLFRDQLGFGSHKTNINIPEALANKRLREDLYYRLNAFTMSLPPLRDRKEEIPILLKHFMSRMSESYARPPLPLSPPLMEACLRHSWPGNLRELSNFIKRYLVLGDEALAASELQPRPDGGGGLHTDAARSAGADSAGGLKSVSRNAKDEAEAEAIARALEETNWNRKQAAVLLKISYKALLYKIRQYGIAQSRSTHRLSAGA